MKASFAARLKAAMLDKGWNQSQLAQQASNFLDKPMGRDSVSIYMRGKSLPGTTHMYALARALGIEPGELLPVATGMPMPKKSGTGTNSGIETIPTMPGSIRLKIDQAVSMDAAMKILQILQNDDPERSAPTDEKI